MSTDFRTPGEWLTWLEQLHPNAIDLGLERVRAVALASGLLSPAFPIITVGGTNGKGSVCAFLESILTAAGYRVGLYTSPHLFKYNERIRIVKTDVDDAQLCLSFAHIEQFRRDVSLTYFEFGTLAAMRLFQQHDVDIAIMEVGLGGRLDAVNLWDASVSVITSLALDHTDWLGDTLNDIAREKSGIARAQRPLVVGEPQPPEKLFECVEKIGAQLHLRGREYSHECEKGGEWHFAGSRGALLDLPAPSIQGAFAYAGAATALEVVSLLPDRLQVDLPYIREGLSAARTVGRAHRLQVGGVDCVFDVAHNPQAIGGLLEYLNSQPAAVQTYAVAAFMADKAIPEMIEMSAQVFSRWYVGDLPLARALSGGELREIIKQHTGADIFVSSGIVTAFSDALASAGRGDRVVVFGSFVTVAETLREHL